MATVAPITNKEKAARPASLNGRPAVSAAIGASKEPVADDWLLWQLVDSAFPTGGFAHSSGLEAAWQHREVRSAAELKEFIKASLVQLTHGILPFMTMSYECPGQFGKWDESCDSFLTNHVANRASRLQGKALLASASSVFGKAITDHAPKLVCGHLAPVFGVVMHGLGLESIRATRMFLFWHLRGWLASAVRLGIVGPLEAQAIQFNLRGFAENLVKHAQVTGEPIPVQTAPLLDIWQGAQDRLYSRLFQS